MADVFLSGKIAKAKRDGSVENYRVINVYDEGMVTPHQYSVLIAYTTDEGGVVTLDDKQVAKAIISILEEKGYEVVPTSTKVSSRFTQAELTVLEGMFSVIEKGGTVEQ